VNLQSQVQLSDEGPVFVSADGVFSFYQEIHNLRVSPNVDGNGALVEYGELVEGEPVNGFVMEITSAQTNGQALTEVVDLERRSRKVTGMENLDKQDETMADNKFGFSYIQRGNDSSRVIYFLQGHKDFNTYVRVEYELAALTERERVSFDEVVGMVLYSLKIYR
jgi:hypothetical protein